MTGMKKLRLWSRQPLNAVANTPLKLIQPVLPLEAITHTTLITTEMFPLKLELGDEGGCSEEKNVATALEGDC